jgi:autotransporter-associated beta strand protein
LAVSAWCANHAPAASLFWDADGSSANGANGGSGTWDASTPNWFNGASDIAWTDLTGTTDTANFGPVAGTVTLGTNLGALGLVFTQSGYTISGGNTLTIGTSGIVASAVHDDTSAITLGSAVSLGGAQSWNVGVSSTIVDTGGISGAATLTKSGGGTLTLAGTDTFSGLNLSAGFVNINNAAALGSGSVAINNGVTLDNTSGGAITNSSSNAITLVGTVSFLGSTDGTHDLNLGTGTVSFQNSTTTQTVIVRAGNLTLGPLVGASTNSLVKQGNGTLSIDNAANVWGNTNISGGTLDLGSTGVLGAQASGTLTAQAGELSASASGSNRTVNIGTLTTSTGNPTPSSFLAGRSVFTLNPGSQNLQMVTASLGARGIGSTILFRGTNLGVNSIASATAGSSNFVFTSPPTPSAGIAGGNQFAATGTGTSGTIQAAVFRGGLVDTSATGNGTAFATYDSTNGVRALNPSTEQTTTYPGPDSGADNVRLDLTGAVGITGAQTNTLQLSNVSGSSQTVTNSGGALAPINGLLFTGTSPIVLSGGTMTIAMAANQGDGVVLSTNSAGVTITTGLTVSGSTERGWTFGGPGNIVINANIAGQGGNGGISIDGPGTVTLNGQETTSSKGIVVYGGTAKLGSSFSQGARLWQIANGGTLDMNGVSVNNVEGLTDINGAGGLLTNTSITPATLTINRGSNPNSTRSFGGTITGNLALTLNAIAGVTGPQVFTAHSSYTGATTLTSGPLQIGITNALPTATALNVNGGGAVAATLDLRGFNQTVGSLSGTGTGQSILNSNTGAPTSILTISGSASTTYGGVITETAGTTGSIALVRSGTGLTALTGNNTYTLGTTVSGGTLLANNATGSTGSGAVNVSNATLGGSGKIAGDVTLSGSSHLAPGDSTVTLNAVGTLSLGSSLTLAPTTTLDYEFNSPASFDQTAVTGALSVGGTLANQIGINLFQPNTTNAYNPVGTTTYNIFSFGSLSGAGASDIADAFKVLNPQTGKSYTFANDGSGHIVLSIISLNPTLTWTGGAGDRNWASPNNWDDGSGGHMVPNGVGATAVFAAASPGTVNLNATNETVGSLSFNNTGSGFTVAASGATLSLDNGTSHVNLADSNGSNTISAPVSLGSNAVGGNTAPVVDVSVANGGDMLTISGPVSGNGSINKIGTGILFLSAGNSYSGGTTIGGGTIQVNSNTSLGPQTSSATINAGTLEVLNNITTSRNFKLGSSGSTIQVDGTSTYEIDGVVSDGASAGTLNLTTTNLGTGTLTLTGANTYSGGTTIASGTTLNVGASGGSTGTVGSGPVAINGNLNVLRTGTLHIPGALSGAGPLSTSSGGTLSLEGANTTYSGNVNITGGTLNVGSTSATVSGTGTLNLSNVAITATAGGTLGNGATSATTAGGFATSNITGAITIDTAANNVTWAQQLVGAVGTTITRTAGTGILTIGVAGNTAFTNGTAANGSNPAAGFQGTFTNTTGPLSLPARGSGSPVADWVFNATDPVTIGGLNGTINFGSLSGSSPITGGSARIAVGNLAHNTTYTGNIAGSFGLNKVGSGTFTVSGQNQFSFDAVTSPNGQNMGIPVIVQSGTLLAGSSSNSVSGPFGSNSTIVMIGSPGSTTSSTYFANASIQTAGPVVVGNEILTSGGFGNTNTSAYTFTLGGATDNTSTFSGPIVLENNLTITQVVTTGSNSLVLSGGISGTSAAVGPVPNSNGGTPPTNSGSSPNNTGAQTLTFAGPGAISVTGAISDGPTDPLVGTPPVVTVTATGGTTTLAAANTYSGNTSVTGGTLTVATAGSVTSNNFTATAPGVLNLYGSIPTSSTVTANGAVNFGAPGSTTASTETISSLTIGSGVTASITASATAATPKTLQVTTPLSISGALDLTNNILIAPTSSFGATLDDVRLAIGTNHQITTSNGLLAVGYGNAGGGNFEARATLLGDSDLDGKVNVADLANLAGNFGKTSGQLWINGDFDYNGNVNVADLADLAGNFGKQLGPSSGTGGGSADAAAASPAAAVASGAAVPEPASLGLIGIGALGLLSRRRRRI